MSTHHVAQDNKLPKKQPPFSDRNSMMDKCICERPRTLVICRACGWLCHNARAKKTCLVHPKTLYLMDIEMCIQCHANAVLLAEVNRK